MDTKRAYRGLYMGDMREYFKDFKVVQWTWEELARARYGPGSFQFKFKGD